MKIEILYEDTNYLVINKPAGLVVHADGRTEEKTVADWILEKYPDIKEVGEPMIHSNGTTIYRPGIVHRIDRDTSGVLAIAKNQESFLFLKNQFQNREVEKKYFAFVYGEMDEEDGVVDRPIGRSTKDFRLWSAQRGARGEMREAVTHYKVLDRSKEKGGDGFSFIEVSPKTGRTHQIRVHMKAINHPVVADPLYAPKREAALGFKRLALHAGFIEFTAPQGETIKAEAPLPKDFKEALAKLQSL